MFSPIKLQETQINQLHLRAKELVKTHKHRTGQALFNALVELSPDLAEQIRGTEADPFHDSSKINKFIKVVCPQELAYKAYTFYNLSSIQF